MKLQCHPVWSYRREELRKFTDSQTRRYERCGRDVSGCDGCDKDVTMDVTSPHPRSTSMIPYSETVDRVASVQRTLTQVVFKLSPNCFSLMKLRIALPERNESQKKHSGSPKPR